MGDADVKMEDISAAHTVHFVSVSSYISVDPTTVDDYGLCSLPAAKS